MPGVGEGRLKVTYGVDQGAEGNLDSEGAASELMKNRKGCSENNT